MRYIFIGLLFLGIACSSGSKSDGSLQLRGGTYTEAEFRTEIRAFLVGNTTFCPSLKGLDDRAIADTLKQVNDNLGVTPKQEADPKDEERAAAIVREECIRTQ